MWIFFPSFLLCFRSYSVPSHTFNSCYTAVVVLFFISALFHSNVRFFICITDIHPNRMSSLFSYGLVLSFTLLENTFSLSAEFYVQYERQSMSIGDISNLLMLVILWQNLNLCNYSSIFYLCKNRFEKKNGCMQKQ